MGKTLIIKGANFRTNAIETSNMLSIAQGTISGSTYPGGAGDWSFSDSAFNNIRLKSDINAGIFVRNGESVSLSGLTGIGYGYFPYSQNNPIHANVLGSSYRQETPTLNSEGADTVVWTNNTGQDVYVWFVFKWNGTDGTHTDGATISPSDVSISYEISNA